MNTNHAPGEKLLIAIGGNAIHPENIAGSPEEQLQIARLTGEALLPILAADNQLVLTHGNGPVVGKIMMRQALAGDSVMPMTMDICVAHSQGGIAYLLMQALENALRITDNERHVVCLLTQVEVDPKDPAFEKPSKPVGFFYDENQAQSIAGSLGWNMKEDAGRGYRHVVPSPEPKHIVDISLIERVMTSGAVVIAGGGGGIPVVRHANGTRHGLEAVVDKDLSSALIGQILKIPTFLILTAVPRVAIHFGTPQQQELDRISASELRALQAEGHFPEGSMGPKVEAALRFIEGGGRRAAIGSLFHAEAVLDGSAGTQITAN